MLLEVIGFDLQGCLDAQTAGANRIELCADPHLGGTSPSFDLITEAVNTLHIPISVMIRPRGGNFCYSEYEVDEMLESIAFCQVMDVEGVVFGALDASGHLDKKTVSRLRLAADGLNTTFHRAFDVATAPFTLFEQLLELEFTRLLTSGQQPTALEGIDVLKKLIDLADDKISVMPGSGITAANLQILMDTLSAQEYHSSAKRVDALGTYVGVDMDEVRGMCAIQARYLERLR